MLPEGGGNYSLHSIQKPRDITYDTGDEDEAVPIQRSSVGMWWIKLLVHVMSRVVIISYEAKFNFIIHDVVRKYILWELLAHLMI